MNAVRFSKPLGEGIRMLTGKQPWWWAIVRAGKRIENRSRILTSRPVDILLHTSQSMTREYYQDAVDWMYEMGLTGDARSNLAGQFIENLYVPPIKDTLSLPRGVVIGRCRIVGLIAPGCSEEAIAKVYPDLDPRWHIKDQWGHVLEDVVPYDKHVPAKGARSIIPAPPEVLEKLEAA